MDGGRPPARADAEHGREKIILAIGEARIHSAITRGNITKGYPHVEAGLADRHAMAPRPCSIHRWQGLLRCGTVVAFARLLRVSLRSALGRGRG